MPNFLNFNNMPNFGIGYTDNLYNQSSVSPVLPSLSDCLLNSYNCTFGAPVSTPYSLMTSPMNSYSQPMTSNNYLKDMLMLMIKMNSISNQTPDLSQYDSEESEPISDRYTYDAENLKSRWGQYNLSDKFYSKVVRISKRVGCDPNALMAVMKSESGLNSKAKNPNGSATGLIQFIESTAKGLGTTTAELKRMSPEKQLDYVEKYLLKTKNAAGIDENKRIDGATLYSLVFLPAYAKRQVLCKSGSTAYNANKGLDLNKDGDIDKTDLARRVNNLMA
ncbi:MAG: transglycosylase SLT domain-containing protein [bacterium]